MTSSSPAGYDAMKDGPVQAAALAVSCGGVRVIAARSSTALKWSRSLPQRVSLERWRSPDLAGARSPQRSTVATWRRCLHAAW